MFLNGCTFGAEEEFMVVDGNGVPYRYDMSRLKAHTMAPSQLTIEPHIGSIEVATPICNSLKMLYDTVMAQRSFLREELGKQGGLVVGASTVPWLCFENVDTISEHYYQEMLDDYGYAVKGLLVFGQHVHVGNIPDTMFPLVFNRWRYLTPLIIALSANSQFFNGTDTGMQSYRNMRMLSMPRSGLPEAIESTDELNYMTDTLFENGMTKKKSQIWTDIRLHPFYHTLEIRMADIQQQDEHAASLAVFIAALTAYISKTISEHDAENKFPRFMLQENRWMACRKGAHAFFLTPAGKLRIADVLRSYIHLLEPFLAESGVEHVTKHLYVMLEKRLSTPDVQAQVKSFNSMKIFSQESVLNV